MLMVAFLSAVARKVQVLPVRIVLRVQRHASSCSGAALTGQGTYDLVELRGTMLMNLSAPAIATIEPAPAPAAAAKHALLMAALGASGKEGCKVRRKAHEEIGIAAGNV